MLKLRELFSSYEEEPPSMFVLMGNFSSSLSALADNVQQLREGFEKLARLVAGYPAIARTSHFVFVPGPTDPGGEVVNILPKHPLPKVFTEPFRARVAHSHFVTNPARYCQVANRLMATGFAFTGWTLWYFDRTW